VTSSARSRRSLGPSSTNGAGLLVKRATSPPWRVLPTDRLNTCTRRSPSRSVDPTRAGAASDREASQELDVLGELAAHAVGERTDACLLLAPIGVPSSASARASAIARPTSSAGATTRCRKPAPTASCGRYNRAPGRASSMTAGCSRSRARSSPVPGIGSPMAASLNPILNAPSAPSRSSVTRSRAAPAAMAWPVHAATTGRGSVRIRPKRLQPSRTSWSRWLPPTMSEFRSNPAQNCPGRPTTTSARGWLASTPSNASESIRTSRAESALTLPSSNLITATPSTSSTVTAGRGRLPGWRHRRAVRRARRAGTGSFLHRWNEAGRPADEAVVACMTEPPNLRHEPSARLRRARPLPNVRPSRHR
jgi:hypothetical protein